jgi:hypothetical protein
MAIDEQDAGAGVAGEQRPSSGTPFGERLLRVQPDGKFVRGM